MRYLETLHSVGIRVMSHQESWVATNSPMWPLLVSFSAWWAKQERQRIGERVRAGQERARAQGVRFGRKPRAVDVQETRRRCAAGQAWRKIARDLKTPMTTLRRKSEPCQKSPTKLRHAAPRLARASGTAEGAAES